MFEAEIERGVRFLDEFHPGWELQLDLGKLRLDDCSNCVLGQLAYEYNQAVEMELEPLGLRGDDIGFDLPDAVTESAFDIVGKYEPDLDTMQARSKAFKIVGHYYDVLTDEWGVTVKDRLNEGVSV